MSDDIEFIDDDLAGIREHLRRIDHHLEQLMSGQASIDAATAAILANQATQATATSTLQADVTVIAAELAAGVSGSVNTTALDAAVAAQPASDAALVSAVNAVTALATPADVITVTPSGDQTSSIAAGPVSLQVVASDSGAGQALSYTASGLPDGLSIDPSAGLISGTPATAGQSMVTVTVSDGTGATGLDSFTWTVTA